MPNKKNHIVMTVMILCTFIALVLGIFVAQHFFRNKTLDPSQLRGTLLEKPRQVSPFLLKGTKGEGFSNASLQGHWTMVFFGFTNCGYLCPTTMSELGKMYRILEERHVKSLPKVVMVSIDPERDNVAKLKTYVQSFNPNFLGATGDERSIKGLSRELGIAYIKVVLDKQTSENFDLEHTGTVLLFNPKGQLSAFFTTPHLAEDLADDYALLVGRDQAS